MQQTLAPIEELLRIPAPAADPMTLACDGGDLWVGSLSSGRLYGMRSATGAVFEECAFPGDAYGAVVTGDALRVIIADEHDARTIRRYIMGKDFKRDALPLPDDTGSFLAYDGDRLYVSQRFAKQIVELDDDGGAVRTIPVPREITGMVIVGGRFYLMTTESRTVDDYRLLRLDARRDEPEIVELAVVPFRGRSLGFDGSRFWTAARFEHELVAFAKPD